MSQDKPLQAAMKAVMLHMQVHGCILWSKSEPTDGEDGWHMVYDCPRHGLIAEYWMTWNEMLNDIQTDAFVPQKL